MSQSRPLSVTDSPWFWLMLFSLAGLAGVVTIGPKFDRREASIEEKFHARERALGREAFEQPAIDAVPSSSATDNAPESSADSPNSTLSDAPPWKPIYTLGPIVAILLAIAAIAMFNVFRFHHRRFNEVRVDYSAKPPAVADSDSHRTTDQ